MPHVKWEVLEELEDEDEVRDAAKQYPRATLLDMLYDNDSNGVYTDEDTELEGLPRITKSQAVDMVVDVLFDD